MTNKMMWLGLTMVSTLCAQLMKSKKTRPHNTLPNFPGLLTVNSVSRGRMRVTLPILRHNESLAVAFIQQLQALPAIHNVTCNLCLGTVVVNYQADEVEPIVLQGAMLKLLGLDKKLEEEAPNYIADKIKQGMRICNYAVSSKTNGLINAKGLLAIAVLGVGIWQIRQAPFSLPNGYTTLRYGLLSLLGKK